MLTCVKRTLGGVGKLLSCWRFAWIVSTVGQGPWLRTGTLTKDQACVTGVANFLRTTNLPMAYAIAIVES